MKINTVKYAVLIKGSAFKSRDGFTMIEMLLSLSIFCVIASLLPLIIQNISIFKAVSTEQHNINFELCLRDIISETKNQMVYVEHNELKFKDSSNKIYSYGYHNGRIIRKVNNSGYTILLENVQSANFYAENKRVFLNIKFIGDRGIRNETIQIK